MRAKSPASCSRRFEIFYATGFEQASFDAVINPPLAVFASLGVSSAFDHLIIIIFSIILMLETNGKYQFSNSLEAQSFQ